ncbi:MAG: 3alpha(or 20beta)-hydroxysteroid dehydrogenase [Verrucomicrobia bacterium]|nr:MAG: 3alpha(or 20beta)-hydroxysteroid dehydrogenase [Verrucomicrobiota bacterium]
MDLNQISGVVTGAARGIGFSIAQALLRAGARVVLSDSDGAALEAAVERLGDAAALSFRADVTSASEMAALASAAASHAGPVGLWVNNAGLARHRAIRDYTESEIDLMLAVNLKGTILGSQAALRAMVPVRRGHIINIISTASLRGIPGETVYCAAKWGARGFTQGLREEAAPEGVRVTALLPGGVDTGFWQGATDRPMPVEDFLSAQQVAEAVMTLAQMDDGVVPQELVLRALRDRDFAQKTS